MKPLKKVNTNFYTDLHKVTNSDYASTKEAPFKGINLEEILAELNGLVYQFQYFPITKKSCFPYVSKGIEAVYGVSSEALKTNASMAMSRVHKADWGKVENAFYSSMENLSTWNLDYRVVLPTKGIRWLRGHGKPEKLNDGSILWNGYISDITDQKVKEEQTFNAMTKIESQNERLLNFAHIVSHNLRTHSGNFESLLEMTDDAEDIDEKLEMISYLKKVSHGLSDTILHLNEIIDVQNNADAKLTTINLYDYVESTIAVFKKDIDSKKIIINNKVPKTLLLQYNASYMESILLNLVSNAIKYRHADRIPEITIEILKEDKKIILNVLDNGIGIDLKKYGHDIFGMYKTFHKNNDAKGIGLFITKNQIEALGGEIKVKSEVNVGTSFSVHFNKEGGAY